MPATQHSFDVRLSLAFILILAAAAAAQPLEFVILKEGVLEQRLHLAHKDNQQRYLRLVKLFEDTGCSGPAFHEQRVKGSKQPNVICEVAAQAETPRKIIVGAHFDCVGGDGVVDNWSGAVLLPGLSESIRRSPRRHAFEFVGFAAEEKGLLGSLTYLRSLSKEQRRQVAAVITMDSLGLTSTKFWPNGSSPELIRAAAGVAATLKLEFSGVNVDRVGTTDSAPFKAAHLPVLSIHSVTQATWPIVNSNKDVWSAISWHDYYDTHRMLSALLVYLDRALP